MAEDKDNLQQIREELHDLNVKYKKLEIASQKKKNKFFNITNLWIPITSILVSIIIAKLTVDNELKIAREQLDLQNINTTQTLIANLLEKEEIITAKNKIQFYIKSGLIKQSNDTQKSIDTVKILKSITNLIDQTKSLEYFSQGYDLNDQAFSEKNTVKKVTLYWKAITKFSQAIIYDPNHSYSYQSKGVAYKELGYYYGQSFYKKALENFNKAVEYDPGNEYNFYLRGVTLNKLGKHKEAITDLKKVSKQEDEWIFQYNYAEALLKTGNKKEGCRRYKLFLKLNSSYKFTKAEKEFFKQCK